MRFKAVLFDLDGTLLDTLEDLADSMNSVLKRFGFPVHPVSAYRYFVGDGMLNLVRRTLPEAARSREAAVTQCFEAMRQTYGQRWQAKTRPYRGVPELLQGLSDRHVPLTILSNKPDDFTKLAVTTLLSSWRFAVVLGERPPIPRKPNPAGALEIAHLLDLQPRCFLYLGDTATDMQTARAAGMFPVGALWGFREAEELKDAGAEALVSRPEELLTFLDE